MFSVSRVGSFGKVWAKTFGGRKVRKISHVKIRMESQGSGFSCGIALGAVGSRLNVSLKG